MTTFGKLGVAGETHLQDLDSVARSTGRLDKGVWLHIARQYQTCALVQGCSVEFRHYSCSVLLKQCQLHQGYPTGFIRRLVPNFQLLGT
jgi:hypothetical protein